MRQRHPAGEDRPLLAESSGEAGSTSRFRPRRLHAIAVSGTSRILYDGAEKNLGKGHDSLRFGTSGLG
jgi:hypothetical protein